MQDDYSSLGKNEEINVELLWKRRNETVLILETKFQLITNHYINLCRTKLLLESGKAQYETAYKLNVKCFNDASEDFKQLHINFNQIEEKLRENGVSIDHIDDAIKDRRQSQNSNNTSYPSLGDSSTPPELSFKKLKHTYWQDLLDSVEKDFTENKNKSSIKSTESQNSENNAQQWSNSDYSEL